MNHCGFNKGGAVCKAAPRYVMFIACPCAKTGCSASALVCETHWKLTESEVIDDAQFLGIIPYRVGDWDDGQWQGACA